MQQIWLVLGYYRDVGGKFENIKRIHKVLKDDSTGILIIVGRAGRAGGASHDVHRLSH